MISIISKNYLKIIINSTKTFLILVLAVFASENSISANLEIQAGCSITCSDGSTCSASGTNAVCDCLKLGKDNSGIQAYCEGSPRGLADDYEVNQKFKDHLE